MKVAITGATGFIGRELVAQMAGQHELKCWHRDGSDREPLDSYAADIEWIPGQLADGKSAASLVDGCDAIVHSGLWRGGKPFQSNDIELVEYARINILGSLELIQAAIAANVKRFIFVSTCAVHDHILEDRPLDERHPLWANSHYGAHKAAIEKFVHSFGLGEGFPICAVRPTGVYGVAKPIESSKWFRLIEDVARNKPVTVAKGGKEVHVADVARAIQLLLVADGVQGQAYSCFDRYISEYDVANIAKEISGSSSEINGDQKSPKHMIDSSKIKKLGMEFGGESRLRETVEQLLQKVGA